jgi:hypothetical protein
MMRLPWELQEIILHNYMPDYPFSPPEFRKGTLSHESVPILKLLRPNSITYNQAITVYYARTTFLLWPETFKHLNNPRLREFITSYFLA